MMWILLLALLVPGLSLAQTPPQLPRGTPNLVTPNPNFNGAGNWYLTGSTYDAGQSRTADGTGSVLVTGGAQLEPVSPFNVTAGKTYMFSTYIMTTQWPPPAISMSFHYDNCGGTKTGDGAETGRSSNSRPNVWEEISLTITPTQTTCIKILLGRFHNEPSNGAGNLWVDEVYVAEGVGFGSSPVPRTAFTGLNMTVDVLGNIMVRRDGVWEDFFPFCIYGNSNRPNYLQYYSDLGFNCDGRSGGASALTAAKNAVNSTYNPKGIMIVTDVGNHLYQCDGCWGWDAAHTQLGNYINEHKNSAAADRQLWWYDDNEVDFTPWQMKMDSMAFLQANDRTVVNTGTRLHPMFMLQGNWNMTRSYRTSPGGVNGPDIAGTYADGTNSGGAGGAGGFTIIENMQNMVFPAVIVNANIVTASAPVGTLRAALYKFLGLGARAWTMWMDCYPPTNCLGAADRLENVPWLNDVGPLRKELDALLPLIKQPHWTTWSVSHNGGPGVQVGTRDYQGPGDATARGHLLIVNDNTVSKTVTFTITGLPYGITNVKDYFTGTSRATPSGAQFILTLDPVRINTSGVLGNNAGSAVVKLDGVGGGDAPPTVTPTAPPPTTTGTSITITGSATDDHGVASMAASCTPSCGSPVVTCTTCGSTATSVTWTVNVPLTAGTNTITVTATDTLPQTTTAQVTVARVLACQEYVRWRMNEGTGTSVADTAAAGAPGTLTNGPTWVAGREGAFGLHFEGTSQQHVRNATLSWPAGQPATIEAWVKIPGGTQGGTFDIGGTNNTVDNRFGCHITWSDNIIYCDYGGDVSTGRVQASFASYLNTWTHVAFTADTTRRALYINGNKAAETLTVVPALPALTGFEVGRYDIQPLATYYHTGDIDDVRLFTCVRDDATILADYTGTSAAPPTLTLTTTSGSTVITTVQVQGTATDDVGVTAVSIACSPACGAPVVTCTPACGATATNVNWTANVPLQLGPNVVTVTATDGVPQSVNQQVTITLQLAAVITNQSAPRGRLP